MEREYKYQLTNEGPTKLIVIDPDTLTLDQKEALLKGTDGFVRGKNFWSLKREDFVKEEKNAK